MQDLLNSTDILYFSVKNNVTCKTTSYTLAWALTASESMKGRVEGVTSSQKNGTEAKTDVLSGSGSPLRLARTGKVCAELFQQREDFL